jgi:hypothetical protein
MNEVIVIDVLPGWAGVTGGRYVAQRTKFGARLLQRLSHDDEKWIPATQYNEVPSA